MKKLQKIYICTQCGEEFSRWAGKCESCQSWNTITEDLKGGRFSQKQNTQIHKKDFEKPIPLSSLEPDSLQRYKTGIREMDTVLGGGIVPGSLVLIGGEPGVGKSTLILEISRSLSPNSKVLYFSGEESTLQISQRAERMGINKKNLYLSSECSAENICGIIEQEKPVIAFVDSIQTVSAPTSSSPPGTVSQLRESTQIILECSKRTGIPVFMTGHITKDGSIAGPKILEHMVDAVLYFEGDRLNHYRILRAVKNRFGAVGDIAVFEMHANGLREVEDRKNIFLQDGKQSGVGSCVAALMEGTRSFALEVQALVSRTSWAQARRTSDGIDSRRLSLLAAVMEKFLTIKLCECDVFTNLTGGLNADDPGLDLALCTAVISSYLEKPVPAQSAFLGEVGLAGEVRSVSRPEIRIKELFGAGIETIYLPERNKKELIGNEKGSLVFVNSLHDVRKIFNV